ncbi:MAG: type II toxin-antitoxin system Phd/YefM family antitoxin [Spirochaetales bacterium]|nr:type II toxin-antitoxin system Phd/YefM family antitoxin [Spirochaetales bacterium]
MKFITVRDLRTTPAQIWKSLPQEQELIITNNGKPIALMTPIGESDLEETIASVRKARAAAAIQNMQLLSAQNSNNKLSLDEINAEIDKSRNEK